MNDEQQLAASKLDAFRGPAAIQRVLNWATYLPVGVDKSQHIQETQQQYKSLTPIFLNGIEQMPRVQVIGTQGYAEGR